MKENNKLRIVPQVLFRFFVASLLYSHFAFALEAPHVPISLEEAEVFSKMKLELEKDAEETLNAKDVECYKKTLISNCLRAVEKERSQFKRDLKVADNAASEFFRKEKVRLKEEKQREREAAEQEKASQAANTPSQVRPEREPAPAPAQPKGKPERQAPPDVPSIPAQEQVENRRLFEEKQKESVRMRAENEKRVAEQEERRKRYKAEQDAKQAK